MRTVEEIRDGWGGDALLVEPPVNDGTTSSQSGETWCYVKDQDVFTEDGRYEFWKDELPYVSLRICSAAELARVGSGTYLFVPPGDGVYPSLEVPGGWFPDVRRPATPPPDDYIPKNILLDIYSFEVTATQPTGVLRSNEREVDFADLFEDEDGNPYTADTYTIRYEPAYRFGVPTLHHLISAIHPVNDVIFPLLSPATIGGHPDYTWYAVQGDTFEVSGTGDVHPLERDNAGEYLPGSVGPASGGVLGGLAHAASAGITSFIRSSGLPTITLGPGTTPQAAFASTVKTFGLGVFRGIARGGYLGGIVTGVAYVGGNYLQAASGHVIGNVFITPEGGNAAARVQLVLD